MPSPSRNPLKRAAASLKDIKARHAERRRPSGFAFAIADHIGLLNSDAWNAVTRGQQFFMQRSILAAIEANSPDNLAPRYALICRGDKPVAAVAAQLVDISGRRLWQKPEATKPMARLIKPTTDKVMGMLEERMLVAGNLMSWGFHGVTFAAGENPSEIWPGIAEALYRIRRAEKLHGETNLMLVKDVSAVESHASALDLFSYRPMETEPNMVLTLQSSWRHYEDYLSALDAKYRRNSRDQIKKLAAAGCVLERVTDLRPIAHQLHALYLNVQSKASVKLVTIPPGYLPALAEAAGDDFRCTVVRRDDRILGFVTSLRDGNTAIGYYIGFDRDAAADGVPLYLRLLHATIADAIDWGCQRLSLGRTALEPKAALGAKPEATEVWLRHRIPALNWIVRGILDAVPHAEAPERNPFKLAVEVTEQ
ncbi:hypothetical protein BH11VER1_BH11VER1_28220 [soil metagenome]